MLKLTRIAAVALIGLAVLLALIAFMIGRKPAAPATVAPVAHNEAQAITVVEAVARLPAGEPISANGLRLAQRTSPVPGAATSIAAVTGKVPVQDIAEGSVINGSALAQGFSLQLRPGERALAVPVDELVGAGNRILPGDFVDVFLNLRNAQPNINSPGEAAQTRLLLSRLRVLSYGQQDIVPVATETTSNSEADSRNDPRAADITGSGSTHSNSNEAPQPARSAVLAVPVADANRLLLGAQQGKLFLALRNPADTGLPDGVVPAIARSDRPAAWARRRTAARPATAGEPRFCRYRQRRAGRTWQCTATRHPGFTVARAGATSQCTARAGDRDHPRRQFRIPCLPLTCIECIHDRTSPPSTPLPPPALAGPAAGAAGAGNERGRR